MLTKLFQREILEFFILWVGKLQNLIFFVKPTGTILLILKPYIGHTSSATFPPFIPTT
jgi:hypothetical protein